MVQTLAQKIIARAAGRSEVAVGETVICAVDLAMMHDSGGPRRVAPTLDRLGIEVWDPDKIVLISDHFAPATDQMGADILDLTRRWAAKHGIRHFYDLQGICHVVVAERGHLRPGLFAVGGDSHSTTSGAFACYMFGIGATEMVNVLATGEIWLKVPGTIRIECTGQLRRGVSAKDIMLQLCAALGINGAKYQALEYVGEAVAAMSMTERMTLSNMATELGAQAGLIAADQVTTDFLRRAGVEAGDFREWRSDEDADYLDVHEIDLSSLPPHVAAPHSPANAAPVGQFEDKEVHQAYIGACTGAKLDDLKMAAEILKGEQVAKGVRLLVAPASKAIAATAAADGTLAALTKAGATILPTGCGACAGLGSGILASGEVCISSSARNFKGRMGSAGAEIYLASPYTVAASAIRGTITDPRHFLEPDLGE